jgi:hypothetical protein
MEVNNEIFNVKKTFGIGVLLKLIKKTTHGITIDTIGDRYVSNVSLNEIKEAVTKITRTHKIQLKV